MIFRNAKCPVDAHERRWIEDMMLWLLDQLGARALYQSEVILPTYDYFPDFYEGTQECAQAVLDRVCQYMRVDSSQVEREFYSERLESSGCAPLFLGPHRAAGTAGLYATPEQASEKPVIGVEVHQLKDPPALVATVAHEIGHFLLRDRDLPPDRLHREMLTDLVPIFLGLGILTSSAAFRFSQWHDSQYQGWQASRQGYLSEPMYGYALAVFAWLRNEKKARWAKHLTPNVRLYFKQSMNYLRRGGETILPAR